MQFILIFLAFIVFAPTYGATSLKNIEGIYTKNRSCKFKNGTEKLHDNFVKSSYLEIRMKMNVSAEIGMETVVLVNQNNLGPQPYSCSFNGIAELRGNKLHVVRDHEGYAVNGLFIQIDRDKISVIDNAEAEHAGYYCGAHVGLNGMVFMRNDKCEKH